jgi:hypothetical protein
VDKENISPTIAAQTKKSTNTNMVLALTHQGRWIIEALEKIVNALKRGQTSLRKVSKSWHILIIKDTKIHKNKG